MVFFATIWNAIEVDSQCVMLCHHLLVDNKDTLQC